MAIDLLNSEHLSYKYSHLGLDFSKIDTTLLRDPFVKYSIAEDYEQLLRIIRDPKNFYFTCTNILNIEPTVFQLLWLQEFWIRPFPMLIAGRGSSKTFTTALYYMLRLLITQGCKIVITSASFRQAKFVFDYMETIWHAAPVYRDLCNPNDGPRRGVDLWEFKVGASTAKCVPLGMGEKIRGLRANYLDVEEFNSVPEEIFETVLRGMTATASNPVENIKRESKIQWLKDKGQWTPESESKLMQFNRPNQILISGTAGFDFSHFAKYHKRYREIIRSKGDPSKIREALGSEPLPGFDWKHYSIIRIPYDLLPVGMMDNTAVSSSKANMDNSRFDAEFGCIFSKNSNGFFPRLLVESCVTKNPINIAGIDVQFTHRMSGDTSGTYVMGIDPASESDNFAIVIEECHPTHNRVVYCWTIKRREAFKRFTNKQTAENSFYTFIARKIRSLMKLFTCKYIALDSQGGGLQVMEALHDLRGLEPGELLLWPMHSEDPLLFPGSKNYGYDDESGLHMIEMVSMSSAEYVVQSNHGLKKDLMNKMLLFPIIDAVSYMRAEVEDKDADRIYDTMEDVVYEVEQLKDELSTIMHTTTQNGRDRFDTPEIILPGNKKGRMRKDRYSALLMANCMARRLILTPAQPEHNVAGGWITEYQNTQQKNNKLYTGPDWYIQGEENSSRHTGQINRNQNANPFGDVRNYLNF